jgi:hypothetical protein
MGVQVTPAKAMMDAGATGQPLAMLSEPGASFAANMRDALAAASQDSKIAQGSPTRANVQGGRNTAAAEAAKDGPKSRKESASAQGVSDGGVPPGRPPTPGAAGWNVATPTPLTNFGQPAVQVEAPPVASAAQTPDSGTATTLTAAVSSPGSPHDVSPASERRYATTAAAAGAADAPQEVGEDPAGEASPGTPSEPQRPGDLDTVEQASRNAAFVAAATQNAPWTTGFHAETGLFAAAPRSAGKGSATPASRRLEAAQASAAKKSTATAGESTAPPLTTGAADSAATDSAGSGAGSVTSEEARAGLISLLQHSGVDAQPTLDVSGPVAAPTAGGNDSGAGQGASAAENTVTVDFAGTKPRGTPTGGEDAGVPLPGRVAPFATILSPGAATGAFGASGAGQTAYSFKAEPPAHAESGRAASSSSQDSSAEATTGTSLTGMHLVQSLGRSEMQVHLNAAEFGRVSVHATYGREGLAAQISLENTELGSALRSALSVHMPGIEQKLGADQGSRASVSISTETGAAQGNGAGGQRGATPERRHPVSTPQNAFAAGRDSGRFESSASGLSGPGSSGRLDIRI